MSRPESNDVGERADAAAELRRAAQGIAPDRTVALVGLMGAGKTTVGRRLAAALQLPFADADDAIVSAAYPFTLLSWRMHGSDVESLFDDTFQERKALRAYAFDRADVTTDQMIGIYPFHQASSLCAIRCGTLWNKDSDRQNMRIHGQMYLGVEPPLVRPIA